jgi:hypothetical protein
MVVKNSVKIKQFKGGVLDRSMKLTKQITPIKIIISSH